MMGKKRECLLSGEEKNRILFEFNRAEVEYPRDKTLHRLFEEQVERTPDKVAVSGVVGIGTKRRFSASVTYRELNLRSNQLAYLLRGKCVGPDSIVGIMLERSIEMIIAILGVLKAGGAYLPIDPGYPPGRIEYIFRDSNVAVLLAAPAAQLKVKEESIELIDISELSSSSISTPTLTLSHVSSANLAYIIYTSGSTGRPKGVPVEHSSVVNLACCQKRYFKVTEDDRILQFSSICFDASVEQIFISLFSGAILVLVDRDTILDIDKFERYVLKHSITHIHAVPSFLLNMEGGAPWHVKRVVSGGDVCSIRLAEKWSKYCDFHNEYGPTETTVTSLEFLVKEIDESLDSLPIGKPIDNTTVYLFDKWKNPVPRGMAGELYIGGDGVTRGYLNRPELTSEKFIEYRSYKTCILYRTGDLARRLPDGNIEFLGRIDHQVKVRGFRVELEEIENQLLAHPCVKEAVVLFRGNEVDIGDGYLCAYIVSDGEPGDSVLREYLADFLPDYMIPSYFVGLESMPLTPTGKIDRRALPGPGILTLEEKESRDGYTAPRNELEMELAGIWSRMLGIEKDRIGVDDNFFKLGGHSLRAILMIAEIRKRFNVCLYLSELSDIPTIRSLGKYLKRAAKDGFVPIKPMEKKEYYPLSPAQKRFYFVYRLVLRSTAYNAHEAFILEGKADKERLEDTFRKLIERHEILRTSFDVVDNDPVQRINDSAPFAVEYDDLSGRSRHYSTSASNPDGIIQEFVRPFDLSVPPLFRVGLIEIEKEKHLFLFDMHHIITDDISFEIFVREFMTIYEGEEEKLPGLKLQYKDFSQWQNRMMDSEEMKRQEAYWLKEFSGGAPVLDIPTDYERPESQDFEGAHTRFEISPGQIMSLTEYARAEGTTMFTVLLAVFCILLAKLSGSDDIVVGTPVAGRRHSDLYGIIGAFINTLALRNYPGQDKTFDEFLKEVKQRTLDAFDNQDYQFEDLVKNVYIKRHSGRNPIFDVIFTFVPRSQDAFRTQGKTGKKKDAFAGFKRYEGQDRQSMVDLILSVVETDRSSRLFFNFKYRTKLFKMETIEKYITYFKEIVSAVVENKHITLLEIKISHDLGRAKTEVPQITFGF